MTENFHTHTARCHHAVGDDRQYIETAIKSGICRLGFSDHVPQRFPGGYVSNIRMLPSELDEYFGTLCDLRSEYSSQIEIYIGFEAEYNCDFEDTLDLLRAYPLDYLILGQHFVGTEYDGVYIGGGVHGEALLKRYVDSIIEAVGTGRFSYIAHPDLFRTDVSPQVYEKHMKRLCSAAAQANIPVEINGHGFYENRHYPNFKFFELARDAGCSILIGCDAHDPCELDVSLCVSRIEEKARKMNISLTDRLILADPMKGV